MECHEKVWAHLGREFYEGIVFSRTKSETPYFLSGFCHLFTAKEPPPLHAAHLSPEGVVAAASLAVFELFAREILLATSLQ